MRVRQIEPHYTRITPLRKGIMTVSSCRFHLALLIARGWWLKAAFLLLLGLAGCGPPQPALEPVRDAPTAASLLGHAIQAGAFRQIDNAERFAARLEAKGLDAYFFLHPDGLYKVRFGNYPSARQAVEHAKQLLADGVLDEYYIVRPETAELLATRTGTDTLRRRMVATAERFLGIPYRWGGDRPDNGFDCSGLSMVVYRLNGINLPRRAADQYQMGREVSQAEARPGDLVFFGDGVLGKKATHVGVYAGNGRFIHAPRQGRNIEHGQLDSGYFAEHFIGARAYLSEKQ